MSIWDKIFGKSNQQRNDEEYAKAKERSMLEERERMPAQYNNVFVGKTPAELDNAIVSQFHRYDTYNERLPSARTYYDNLYHDYGGLGGVQQMRNTMRFLENPVDYVANNSDGSREWDAAFGNKGKQMFIPTSHYIDGPLPEVPIRNGGQTGLSAAAYRLGATEVTPGNESYKVPAMSFNTSEIPNEILTTIVPHEYQHALQDATNRDIFEHKFDYEYEEDPFEREARLSAAHAQYMKEGNRAVITSKDSKDFYNWMQSNKTKLFGETNPAGILGTFYKEDKPVLLNPRNARNIQKVMQLIVDNQDPKKQEIYA